VFRSQRAAINSECGYYGHLDHAFFASPAGDRVVMNEALQTQTLLVGFAYKLGPPSPLVAQR